MQRIRLLGGIQIDGPDGVITGRAVQRARLAVLAVLATSRTNAVSRERLMALLWPESQSDRAHALLRDAIYRLRASLAQPAVIATSAELRLDPAHISCDVWDFEDAVARGDVERADGLYQGPFIDGFSLRHSAEFDQWADAERRRMADMQARALESIAEQRRARGDWHGAVSSWRRLAVADPYNGRIATRLMEALDENGDRAGALKQAALHSSLLQADLSAAPDPLVSAYAATLRLGESRRTSPPDRDRPTEATDERREAAVTRTPRSPTTADELPERPSRSSVVRLRVNHRFQSAADVVRALTGGTPRSGERSRAPTLTRRSRSSTWRSRVAAATAAVIVVGSLAAYSTLRFIGHASNESSVAVLTFTIIGGDTGATYLAQGLADGITTSLSGVTRLNIVSRTAIRRSADAARATSTSLGAPFGAAYLVGGSVQRAQSRLVVTAELVRAQSGKQVWTARYDTAATDLVEVQSRIAEAVATAVAGKLLPGERIRVGRRPTASAEAYDHYLRGNGLLWIETEQNVTDAIAEYQAALALDSTFTSALGRLAYAYSSAVNQAIRPGGLPAEAVLERALTAADRALRQDSTNADAWLGKGIALQFRGTAADFNAAAAALRRAVVLDSTVEAAHHWYAVVLRRLGRYEEASQEYHRALAINPAYVQPIIDLGALAFTRRSFKEAVQWIDRGLRIDPTNPFHMLDGEARLAAGDIAGARREMVTALNLATPSARPRVLSMLAVIDARAGDRARAAAEFQQALQSFLGTEQRLPATMSVRDVWELALGAVAVNKADMAIDLLDRAQPRGPWLWSYLTREGFDPIRRDPRFQRMLNETRPPGAKDPE